MNAATTAIIAKPGGNKYHHAPYDTDPASCARDNIVPHDTRPGSPKPRNDNVASANTDDATCNVADAAINGNTPGNTCRRTTCHPPAPNAFARSTCPRVDTDNVAARTNRAVDAHDVNAIATMIVACVGPNTVANAIANTNCGNTRNQSVTRINTHDTPPPACPATKPTNAPNPTDNTVAANPTNSDTRAPHNTNTNTDRPTSSVPNQNRHDGPSNRPPSAFVASKPDSSAINGANTANTPTTPNTTAPTTPARLDAAARNLPRGNTRGEASLTTHAPEDQASDTRCRPTYWPQSPPPKRTRTSPATTEYPESSTPDTSTTPTPAN